MFLVSVIFFSILGFCLGILTGLIPGIHPNTVSMFLLGFLSMDPFLVSVLIVSTAVTHTFFDFIPSIIFGAPNPDTALSVLPGHRMMMDGRAYEAIYLTVVGGIVSLFLILAFLPFVSIFIKFFWTTVKNNIHWILISIVFFMFLRDRKPFGVVVFTLSGILGLLMLKNNILGGNELFPMLSGLFGFSTILYSSMKDHRIPKQRENTRSLGKKDVFVGGIVGSISGILVGLLPGIGAAQATFLSQEVLRKKSPERFMIAIGGVNTVVAVVSLLSLWLIEKPRSGVSVVVNQLINLGLVDVVVFVGAILFVSGISGALTLLLSKRFVNLFRKIDYGYLNILIILLMGVIVFALSGVVGILLASLSTLIGMTCILSGTRRTYLMGCLIVPTILFFL